MWVFTKGTTSVSIDKHLTETAIRILALLLQLSVLLLWCVVLSYNAPLPSSRTPLIIALLLQKTSKNTIQIKNIVPIKEKQTEYAKSTPEKSVQKYLLRLIKDESGIDCESTMVE